jgi:hypothetical protein
LSAPCYGSLPVIDRSAEKPDKKIVFPAIEKVDLTDGCFSLLPSVVFKIAVFVLRSIFPRVDCHISFLPPLHSSLPIQGSTYRPESEKRFYDFGYVSKKGWIKKIAGLPLVDYYLRAYGKLYFCSFAFLSLEKVVGRMRPLEESESHPTFPYLPETAELTISSPSFFSWKDPLPGRAPSNYPAVESAEFAASFLEKESHFPPLAAWLSSLFPHTRPVFPCLTTPC